MNEHSKQAATGVSTSDDRAGDPRVEQRLWIAPAAMAGIFVAIVLLLLVQMNTQVSSQRQADLLAVADNLDHSLHAQFKGDLVNLYKFVYHQATGLWGDDALRRQAEGLMAGGRSLAGIACYDSNLNLCWSSSDGQDSQFTGLDITLPEPQRAVRRLGTLGGPEYTEPYRDGNGELVMVLFVPVHDTHEIVGFAAATYRIDALLKERIAPILANEYHASLELEPGNILGETHRERALSDGLKHRIDLDPPGHGFILAITAYREETSPTILLLALLCIGLGLGLAWSSFNLRLKLAETRRARDALKAHRERLEITVVERTADLARSNRQLQEDIAERRRTEKALQQSESTLKSILVAAPMGIGLAENDRLEWCNDHLVTMLGYGPDDVLTMPVRDLCENGNAFRRMEDQFNVDGFVDTEISMRRQDDSLFMARIHLARLDAENPRSAVIAVVEDISEKVKTEAGLRRAQKMQAIGTLAGGIAHDFNNVLYAMMGYVQLVLDDVESGGEIESNLKQVVIAGRRAADLVHQISTFSNREESEKRPLRLQDVIEDNLALLRGSLPATIELRLEVDRTCGSVLAEPTHMHQVMMNIGTNAYYAMRTNGGVLSVSLREKAFTREEAAEVPDLPAGRYAVLTVQDTGCGMDSDTADRVFEPYFTTKNIGEGSGVGLATVHGIVNAHDGVVTVESEIGKGSTFTVYLPILGRQDEVADIRKTTTERPHGRGVILLVDDEEMIVELGREFLARLGYEVVQFSDSPAALRAFHDSPERYDLVITDHTMPHLTGLELSQEILSVRPELPIILTSGYSNLPDHDAALAAGVAEYLPKPIGPERLARVVARLLGQREAMS